MKLRSVGKINKYLGQLKPYTIPYGFILVIDTREQEQLFKDPIDGLTIIEKALKDGDYSIKGFESTFTIERKMISDFYSYVGRERNNKTVPKMERFKAMVDAGGFVGLAIEASEEEVIYGFDLCQVPPEVARQAINSFRIRYGVHVYFNKSREYIERFILDSAIKYYKTKREVTYNGRRKSN